MFQLHVLHFEERRNEKTRLGMSSGMSGNSGNSGDNLPTKEQANPISHLVPPETPSQPEFDCRGCTPPLGEVGGRLEEWGGAVGDPSRDPGPSPDRFCL